MSTTAMDIAEAIRQVMAAGSAEELFGTAEPAGRYRRLARLLHPDRLHPDGLPADQVQQADRIRATEAFVRMTELWQDTLRRGTSGRGEDSVVIRAGGTEYRLGTPAYAGDLADLYDAGGDGLLKLPRQPANNDLMQREARALRILADQGDPRYLPYVPRLADSFRHRDLTTGAQRQVNVVAAAPGLHSLIEVRQAYPDGVDARDAAWMWRRLLVALGFAHRAGLVHGAVLPGHVLIEPEGHGVVLVDWCYSAVSDGHLVAGGAHGIGGEPIPAIVTSYADWYPPEVEQRHEPGPGTDIAMASRCMTWLMGDQAPRALRRFADGCSLPSLRRRPDDAWRLLAELDEHLEGLYGPRTFRPFTL